MERAAASNLYQAQAIAPSAPVGLLATLTLWQRRIISRHQLARLDARLLADAGITEAERSAELNKPFWR